MLPITPPAALLLAALMFCGSATAQGLDAEDVAFLDSFMLAKYPPDGPGGVLLVAKDGLPVYRKAFGLASMELRVPNHPGNVFKIASNTKQFTAVAVLQLAGAGALDLDADIRTYLPEFGGDTPITVAQLLNHTSGIPSNGQLPEMLGMDLLATSAADFVRFLGQQSVFFTPGEDFSYSNNAFDLAGVIVERVSGLSLTDYYQQRIFDPLGMRDSYTTDRKTVVPGRATGYRKVEGRDYRYVREEAEPSWSIGSGFISSTVDDLLRWNEGLLAGTVLSDAWRERAWTPTTLSDGRIPIQ